ncbi:MAG: hypothetical protein IJT04_04585 [Bacteroidales bacterium]|nr:hypothetical protein [Bacteroidales bacterium]
MKTVRFFIAILLLFVFSGCKSSFNIFYDDYDYEDDYYLYDDYDPWMENEDYFETY